MRTNLTPKYGAWGNLHVMAKFEVRCKGQSLLHRLKPIQCIVQRAILLTYYISEHFEEHRGDETAG